VEKSSENKKGSYGGLAAIFLSVATMIALVLLNDPEKIWNILLAGVTPQIIFASFLVVLGHICLGAERFRQVLKAMGTPISFSESVLIRMGCSPLKFIIPLKAGELVKPLYLQKRHHLPFASGLSAIIFEKLTILIAVAPFLFVAAILSGKIYFIGWAALVFLSTILLFLPIFRRFLLKITSVFGKKIYGFASKLLSSFETISPAKGLMITGYTVVLHIIEVYLFLVCFSVAGLSSSMTETFNGIVFAQLFGFLPIFISGIGGREAALLFLLGDGTNQSIIVAGGILFSVFGRLSVHFTGLLWMPAFLTRVFEKKS